MNTWSYDNNNKSKMLSYLPSVFKENFRKCKVMSAEDDKQKKMKEG